MPKIVDHNARRNELAAAACEAIFQNGVDALKLTDVAKIAGYTTGALTHYFESKDALILAALDYAWGSIKKDMYVQLQSDELDALKFFSEILPTNKEKQKAAMVWFQYWLRGIHSPELAQQRAANLEEWLEMMRQCLTKLQKQGKLAKRINLDDFSTEIEGIDAMVNGIALQGILEPEAWPAERQVRQLEHYLNIILN